MAAAASSHETRLEGNGWTCVFRRLSIPPFKPDTLQRAKSHLFHLLLPLSPHLITCLRPQSPSFAPPRSKAKPHLASSPNVRSSATPARPTSRTPAQLVSFRNFAHGQTHNHTLTHHHRHLTTRSFDRAALTALHLRAIIAICLDP